MLGLQIIIMGISVYTRNTISTSSCSSVLAHNKETGYPTSFSDLSILSMETSQFDVLIQ